jgi:hypothetical protein
MQEQLNEEHRNILTNNIINNIIANIMHNAISHGNLHSVHSCKYDEAIKLILFIYFDFWNNYPLINAYKFRFRVQPRRQWLTRAIVSNLY